jgi:adenosine/AMP kinase
LFKSASFGVLGDGYYPINVLNAIKLVPEVCRIFCATANPTEVIVDATAQGRGILGVVDGFSPQRHRRRGRHCLA